MKFFLLALAVAFVQGCSLVQATDDPWHEIALAVQPQIDIGQSSAVYVVSDALPPQAVRALSNLRTVIRPSEVPTVAGYSLPPGYVIISAFEVSAGHAVVSAQGGPIVSKSPVSCGYNVRVRVRRTADRWVAEQAPIATC